MLHTWRASTSCRRARGLMGKHVISRGAIVQLSSAPCGYRRSAAFLRVAAPVWAPGFDVEAIASKAPLRGGRQVSGLLTPSPWRAHSRRGGQVLVQLGQEIRLEAGVEALATVRGGQQAAEVRSRAGLDQERQGAIRLRGWPRRP